MMVTPVINGAEPAVRRRAPRLAGEMRRAQIVQAACRFFAEHGFSGPTRDLAASIGVTQALLYRYFDSKTDLIDAVFAEAFSGHWGPDALAVYSADAGRPMVDRLVDVYGSILPRMTGVAIRLMFRAGLDAHPEPISRSAELSWPLWSAMVETWRTEAGLPALAAAPMMDEERALVQGLHDAMVMIRVREHIFHAPSARDDAVEIRQVAELYDAGVRAAHQRVGSVMAGLYLAPLVQLAQDSPVAA